MIAHESVLTETVREYADVVFPAEAYAEKEGTLVHPDGRLQRLRPAIGRARARPGGGVRAGWQVIADVAARAGHDLGVAAGPIASRQLFEAVPFYAGLTLDAIGGRGVRWPAHESAAQLEAAPWQPATLKIPRGARAPRATKGALRLGTYRSLWSSKEVDVSPALKFLRPQQVVELSPRDAERLGVGEGDRVELGSERHARARPGAPARRGPARLGVHRRGHADQPPTCSPTRSWRSPRRRPRSSPAPSRSRSRRPSRALAEAPPSRRSRSRPPTAIGARRMSVLAEVGYYEAWWIQLLKGVLIFAVVFQLVPIILLVERKLLGRFQHRYGPNRVGPFGMLQPMADIGKLVFKEQFRPRTSIGWLFAIAPAISMMTAVATVAIIPFSDTVDIFGTQVGLYGVDASIGILYAFAFGGIAFYGLMLGGWASGSKYSFLGSMRAAAQLISYEVSQGLAIVGVVMQAGSLSLTEIVDWQEDNVWFIVPQFVGFLIFLVAALRRDQPPRRSTSPRPTPSSSAATTPSTAAGASPPYFAAEYLNVLVVSGLTVTLFLGGWNIPFVDPPTWVDPIVVLVKMIIFSCFFIWVRATLPRLRYDQLMSFGWKILLPLATLNALVTAILVVTTDVPVEPRRRRRRRPARPPPRRRGRRVPRLRRDAARSEDDLRAARRGPDDDQYPEEKVPVYPRFRGRHKLHRFEDSGLEKCVGCSLCAAACPADCIRVVAAENTPENRVVGRRALRRGLRDQPLALHLLRLLRGRVPVRRDHDGPRLRDVGLQPLRPDLHQGDAAGRAARTDAVAGRGRIAAMRH